MSSIKYIDAEKKVLNNNFVAKSILISGKRGSGKTTLAIEKYKHLISKEKVKSERILCLYMNRFQGLKWKEELVFNHVGAVNTLSYLGFIRKELVKYWPIVTENCKEINKNLLKPKFMNTDVSNYMMKMLVDYYRVRKDWFSYLNTSSINIAKSIISNMNDAAISSVPFEQIGNRLFYSIEVSDLTKKQTYDEIDKITSYYRSRLITNGMLDHGLSISIYNQYLLSDKTYQTMLKKRMDYIMIDNFEEISPVVGNLLNIVMPSCKKNYFFKNPEGGFLNFYGADKKHIEENLNLDVEEISIDEGFLSRKELINFAGNLEKILITNKKIDKRMKAPIQIDISAQFRNEMIAKVCEKINTLVEQGQAPEDICIISPNNDLLLIHEIKKLLKSKKINLFLTSKKDRLIENSFIQGLIVLAVLCNKYENIKLTLDDYRIFLSFILERSSLKIATLAKQSYENSGLIEMENEANHSKYKYLKDWIDKYRLENISLQEFFRIAYLEILIELKGANENIHYVKKLIESAEDFINVISDFDTIKNVDGKFIDFIMNGAVDFLSLSEIKETFINEKYITLTSPYTFVNSNMCSKIQIWVDINSDMWVMRNKKEISNPYVLKNNWKEYQVYTDEMEIENINNNVGSLLNGMIKKCSKEIYIYGSEYSIKGYQQQNILCDAITDTLNETGDNDEV